jgi:hypothetical protein
MCFRTLACDANETRRFTFESNEDNEHEDEEEQLWQEEDDDFLEAVRSSTSPACLLLQVTVVDILRTPT